MDELRIKIPMTWPMEKIARLEVRLQNLLRKENCQISHIGTSYHTNEAKRERIMAFVLEEEAKTQA